MPGETAAAATGPVVDRTRHRLAVGDARRLPLPDDSVHLVVTSPPYPMVEMWDEDFRALEPAVGRALEAGDGPAAHAAMHEALRPAWAEVARVLAPGGVACVNVGDAVRSVDGAFRRYPNAAPVSRALREAGLRPLPGLLWHKPTNGPTKFMGSMRPPNGYVTTEHERVLVFRAGGPRSVDPDRRAASAYFWEERNRWFSDGWEIAGTPQDRDGPGRARSGAFPLEVPYRLVNMFSVQGEVVLDPFCGTGTTSLAAAASARHSVGVDADPALVAAAGDRADAVRSVARERGRDRLAAHEAFLADRAAAGDRPDTEAVHYDTRVVSEREREIALPRVTRVTGTAGGWTAEHALLEVEPT